MINKGLISDISADGKTATVTPFSGGTVTVELPVPLFLLGVLEVNTPVVYVFFEDNTGVILSRMDGITNNGSVQKNLDS